MASFTRDFGLNRFGGGVGGSIADDGYKFSTVDRDFLDVALEHLQGHTHLVYDKLADPTAAPTGTLHSTGGVLAPGLELHYVITYLDQNGMETGRSASLVINTPDVGAPPGLPALVGATGGALVVGNYAYWLTVLTAGVESAPSPSASITLQTGQGTIVITSPDGVGTYNVYRQGPADGAPYKVAQIVGASSHTDTGVVAPSDVNFDPTQLLPTAGVGLPGTYSVTISVPTGDATLVNGLPAWRLYATVGSDTFESPALVHTIVETVNPDGGGLVTSWIDAGEARLYGQPPYVSQTMASHAAESSGSGGGAGGGYVQAPVLTDANGRWWAMTCSVAGDLSTIEDQLYGTPYNPGYGPCLIDTSGQYWQLAVAIDGSLSTTAVTPGASDPVFDVATAGPVFYSARNTGWRLGVAIDGSLTTTAI